MIETRSDIQTQMAPYQDEAGLYHTRMVQIDGLPPTANGILTTCEFACLRELSGDYKLFLGDLNALHKCRDPQNPGLYNRSPVQTDQEAQDDYIGIGAFAAIAGLPWLAAEVVDYGQDHYWVFNNVSHAHFSWKAWLGRYPQVVAHLKFAAGRRVGILLQIAWAIDIMISAHSDAGTNQTGFILSWLAVQTHKAMGQPSKICSWASEYWWARFRKNDLSMSDVFEDYVADGGKHPLIAYWKDYE